MTKAASCILLIATSVCIHSISGATLPQIEEIEGSSSSKKGFTYLGAVPGKKTLSRGISTQAVSSYYFLSQNSVSNLLKLEINQNLILRRYLSYFLKLYQRPDFQQLITTARRTSVKKLLFYTLKLKRNWETLPVSSNLLTTPDQHTGWVVNTVRIRQNLCGTVGQRLVLGLLGIKVIPTLKFL